MQWLAGQKVNPAERCNSVEGGGEKGRGEQGKRKFACTSMPVLWHRNFLPSGFIQLGATSGDWLKKHADSRSLLLCKAVVRHD